MSDDKLAEIANAIHRLFWLISALAGAVLAAALAFALYKLMTKSCWQLPVIHT